MNKGRSFMQSLLIVPEPVYMILLLCSWVAAMFTGIGFVYGIQMKKEKWAVWGIVFFLCLCLIFLLMNGIISSAE